MPSSTKTLSLRICTLSQAVSREHRSALKSLDAAVFGGEAAWGDGAFDSSIRGKFEVSVLACVHEEVAGFAVASQSDDETVHIHRIAVDPMFRNEQLGRQLVNSVEARAVESGARRVTLEFADTLKIAGFYESLGYKRASDSGVSDYLKRKGKQMHEGFYLPLRNARRLVYFKSVGGDDVIVNGHGTQD